MDRKPPSQSIADATDLIGPALRSVGAPAGAMDGWTALLAEALG